MPAIGALRHRVTLQARTLAPDDATGLAETFATVAAVYALVEPISGGRYLAGTQVEAVATHRVTVRWRADLEGVGCIRWGDKRLRVQSIAPDGLREFAEFLCEETTTA